MRMRRIVSVAALALLFGGLANAQQQNPPTASVTSQDLLDGLKNPSRWLTFSGDYTGQRHSPLKQLTPQNVAGLVPQWIFQTDVPGMAGRGIENTPLVVDGILYVTGNNDTAWALDGRTGRPIWSYRRLLPPNFIASVCCGPVNRGFGILGDRLYLGTLDSHLVALNRMTGQVIWDVAVGDLKKANAITAAPLVVKNKVIIGVAGGDFSSRGYINAYDAQTGEQLWHFDTIPNARPAGQRFLAQCRSVRARRRRRVEHGHLRSGAQPRLLRHGKSQSRLLRRRSRGRQSLHLLARRAGRRHRQTEVAFPVHPA